jgi:acetyl esterase/lipase
VLGRLTRLIGPVACAAMLLWPQPALAKGPTAPPIYKGVSYGPSPSELATVYAQSKPRAPIVVLVHGGGWRLQPLPIEESTEAKGLQRQGYAVFDINFAQASPTERAFPLETGELAAATEWAIAHAAAYDADPSNVILFGGSSGGQLVARVAEQLDAAAPGTVRAVVSLSGPMNFLTLLPMVANGTIKDKPFILSIGQALGCTGQLASCSPTFAAEWSPALHIPESGCPDWLLFSSEMDVAETAQGQEMLADLSAAGCRATLDIMPTGHGFSLWPAVAPQAYAFLAGE